MFCEVWVIVAPHGKGSLKSVGRKSLIRKAEAMLEQYIGVEQAGTLIKEGRFDFWDPDLTTVTRVSSLLLRKVLPSALVTPEGKWREPKEGLEGLRWGEDVCGNLNRHMDGFAVRIWYHI